MAHPQGPPESSDPGCPKRPRTEAELDFVRRPMVRWFDPHQLLDTAARVVASGVWSSYVDSRELQAQVPSTFYDRSSSPDLWLDYVSDLGDGWNPTFTVASLLAQQELEPTPQEGGGGLTARGQVLVMGGDQVYPVPKRTEYENRLVGPYRAAMPCAEAPAPDLFAIPGSHDWYDGLINFTNVFCRGRSIGAWRTSQTRSYFALKLPHRWWLWGVDMQFGDYLDEVQLRYFADVAAGEMRPGDSLVLCMAKEVESGRKSAEVCSDRDLRYLEREIIEPAGGRVELYLKSGRHYYCRYEEDGGSRQLITAGGGGAFMHPTQDLPERSGPHVEAQNDYRRAAVYPSAPDSKRLRKRVFLLPAYNLPLAAVFGGVQVLLAFMLNLHLRGSHVALGFGDLRRSLWESPTAFLLMLLIIVTVGVMIRLAHDASGATRLLLGGLHSLMLFGTLVAVMLAASRLSSAFGDGLASLLAFLGLVGVLGGIGGVLGIAAYLWVTNCFGFHGNEAYAPLHHMDYKNFLRLHVDRDGSLTVYPFGIDRAGRKWELCPDARAEDPWFAPIGAKPQPHLIEPPIRIKG